MVENQAITLRKCPSLINGLDQILHGGLPFGRTTLVTGGPGTGKSLFGLEFLYRSALSDDPGIFISFEETAAGLRDNAITLGWDLAPLEQSGKLFLFEARIDPQAIVAGEFGIQGFIAILDRKLKAMGAKRIVIDAIDVLLRLINDANRAQNELLTLHQWLAQRDITAMLTMKAPSDCEHARHYDFMDYMVDCVITLDNRMVGQLSTRRLRVIKYRGSGFGSNEYPFVIDRPGITLLPISDVTLQHRALGDKFSTGMPALDSLMDGGLRRGSSVLISGSSGTGKTTLCSTLSHAACLRDEKVLYISFEESEAALVSAMLSPGIDLHGAIAAGNLRLLTTMPEAMGAEQHLVRSVNAIEQMQPIYVVLESASACKRMGTEQAAFEYMMRVINFCKGKGITILVTNQTAGFMNQEEVSGIGVSSIVDAIILLRLAEEDGELRRKLLVMKSRGSSHSHRYHDFHITDHGVDLSQEYA